MKRSNYNRVAHRAIALAHASVVAKSLEEFRAHAELAGIRVNHEVFQMKDLFNDCIAKANKEAFEEFRSTT